MNASVINSLFYTLGWFWCVFCGISGSSILALIGGVFFIFIQLYNIKRLDESLYLQDLLLVIFIIPLGILMEMFFISIHAVHYENHVSIFPPIWIILLYPLFSLLLNHSLKIMRRNPFIAFLFGLLGAPLSYFSGYSLGAVVFFYSMPATWILLGVSWGLFLCLLTKIARVLEKVTAQTLEDRDSTTDVDLLYDGDCPICKCEICYLQKKDQHRNVNFVNIASEEFASGQSGIDYETAMSQIHAIDGKGNVIIGLPAFAIVYARCGLLLTSTLLRIPLFKIFLNPLYRLFARNRLRMTGRTFFTRKNKRQP